MLHSRDIAPTDPSIAASRPMTIHHRGRNWQSWWDVSPKDGALRVWGAYGSKTVPKDRLCRRNPEKLARELLLEIVKAFSFSPVPEIHQTGKRRRTP